MGDDVAWRPFNCAGGVLQTQFGEGDGVNSSDELQLLLVMGRGNPRVNSG